MGKKLLSVFFLLSIFFLSSSNGFGQECPTSVSISANPGTTICAGTDVTFTANPSGGSGYEYQWQLNSSNITGANSSTYSTTSLANGAKIKVIVTSSSETACSTTSNELTMTVNAVRTPTVSVSSSKTSICPGESVSFTASNTNGGTSPEYAFYLNEQPSALQSGTSNVYTTTSLTDGDRIRVVLTSKLECITSEPVVAYSGYITVRAGTPAVPGTIGTSVGTEICPGTSQTYSISAVTGATSYQWVIPSGWSGSSTSNSINVTAGTSNGSISVKAINDCGTSEPQSLAITIKAGTPAVPGTITGTASVCPGVAETYSVAAVSGATEYIWSLPNGWTGTSTTNSIAVTTGASGTGSISVQAKNDCGTSAAKTLAVSVKPGTPATPGTISGTAAVCPGVSQIYSISAVTGATSYIWTLPNGWTGTSTTNSITATSGTTGGNITVKATNDCGTSTEQTLAVTVKPGTPATPGLVSGSNLVCPGTSETYSVSPVNGATEYIWTLPSGWTGTSSSETIIVTSAQSGTGNITVKAKNDCGTSTAATIAVSVDKPAPVMSGSVTGPVEVCSTATGMVYSIPAITNATEYLWTLPSGWNITAGTGTNSITVSASSSSGNISVTAKNTCGESAASANLAVNSISGVPSTPGSITAPNLPTNAICPPATGIEFTVPTVTGAKSYLWTIPSGWEITSGSGTNSIVVKVNATAVTTANASVSVEAVNICGNSSKSTLSGIAIDNHVITNAGADQTVCKLIAPIDIVGDYSFSGLRGTLRTEWTVPAGMGTFDNSSKLAAKFTPTQAALDAGSVVLTLITDAPSGACGPGKDEIKITFKPLPTATLTATSPVCNGNTSTLTFTGTPNSRITYRLPNSTTQTIDIGSSGTATVTTAALTANSTYTLVSAINLDTPACSNTLTGSTTITVTPKPTASISYAGPFCSSLSTAQGVALTGTHAYTGGVFSSTQGLSIDSSSGAITPSTSTPGKYTVTYNTPEAGDCAEVTATTEVTITKAPTATISFVGTPFCTSDSTAKPVTLTGTDGFSGGTFSAPAGLTINSGTGAITASSSTPGTYTVTYNTPVAGGCSPVPATTEVTITKEPTVTISYPEGPFCLSDTSSKPVTITGTNSYTGGTYSAPAGLSINTSTGEINPSASNVGTHTVTYTSPATSGCGEVIATTDVTITQTPAAEISYAGPYCTSDATAHLPEFTNTAGNFQGGIYRSTPEGLSLNTTTGAINAQNSSPNTYTVIYQLPAGSGCGTSEIETQVKITQVPQLELSYTSPLCTSDTSSYSPIFSSNAVGAYQNGTFTATSGLAIDSEGIINASSSTPGIHTITYTTPDANGCGPVVVTTQVEIFEKPVITTSPVNIGICSTEPASFEVVASGDNLTYQWKRVDGAAITNATGVNTAKLHFNNATDTNAGEYFVEVSGSSPCSTVSSEPVTLNVDENIVIIKPTEDLTFCDQERADVTFEFIAHAKGAPLTFTWIKDGADIPGTNTERFIFAVSEPVGENAEYTGTFKIVNPNPSDNGVYAVRIKGPDYFTCSEATSKTFTLNVTPLPEPPSTEPVVLCQGQTAAPLTASGATGATFKWYNSAMEPIEGVPTPSTVEAGSISYYVTQTTEVCESNPTELIVTINPTPALPTTQEIVNYCFEEGNISALTATGTDTNATINWYGPNDSTKKLETAPVPVTSSTGITKYWVSQSIGECESERVEITVTIDPLPEIAVSADSRLICAGSSTTLHATGADSYSWTLNGEEIGITADLTVTPSETSTYVLTGTNISECINTTEITIEVDEPTVVGTLQAPTSVCINNPNGTLTLSGYTGEVIKWETKPANSTSTTWTEVDGNKTSTLNFSALTVSTDFRVTVKNGVCSEATVEARVNVDALPIGGKLAFADIVTNTNDGRIMTICQGATEGYRPITLTGHAGTILGWKYSVNGTPWVTISGETGNILSADKIKSLNLPNTTVFRVEISSGVCTPNVFSQTAILSVISTKIEPTPVTVSKPVICYGEQVTLSSETGYTNATPTIAGGSFDNAGLKNGGWRFRFNGNDANFETNANNVVPDFWSRATPRTFPTANLSSPHGTSEQLWDPAVEDGNKGFALVSGRHTATMETNVFSIGSMDQALLTFDQAYNLTPGATITVEISRDGGVTYEKVLFSRTGSASSGNYGNFGTGTPQSRPNNKMVFDLGDYLGQNNLRVRFTYKGARTGDLWAVDAVTVPQGPRNVTIEWNDYTNPDLPILIGNTNSVPYIPTKIGLNIFEVKTKLVFDSAGNTCPVAVNAVKIEVFVFDKYTTTATANSGSCGSNTAQLSATVTNAAGTVFNTFPTPDGYVGEWKIEGGTGYTLIDSNTADQIAAINDPNAILSANDVGSFKASFILKPTMKNAAGVLYENKDCQPVAAALDVVFQPCTTLDFDGVDDFVDLGEGYTGDYSIEAWIRPEASTGTIISTPQLEINMADLPGITPNTRWYHIAVDSDGLLYIDGIASGTTISKTGTERAFIGARWNAPNTENHFSGWIEEVRIWNGKISEKNIRFTMNQRLKADGNIGVVVDMAHPDAPAFGSLAGYYQLIATNILNGGYTPTLAGTVNGKLRNMTTLQENTAPLPYTSNVDVTGQDWETDNTWTHHAVWDPPYSAGINGTKIEWNIVRTSTNIFSNNKDIKVLGLISEVNTLTMEGVNPTGWQSGAGGSGNPLTISHYLRLDGGIDLVGESQLLQPELSIVDTRSSGWLERDQQGTASSYNYNYWSSPVSSAAGNVPYTIGGAMKDGSNPASGTPANLNFGDPYAYADGAIGTPRKISRYWLNLFHGNENVYAEWHRITEATAIPVGEGYTMKGTSGNAGIPDAQNYTFRGIPNNGDVNLSISAEQSYLIGNPYPSAIDADKFIKDNLLNVNGGQNTVNSFNGTLYFWSHFGGKTHILKEYEGGYAVYNLSGGIVAINTDERILNSRNTGGEAPRQFIPVGQSFFINSTSVAEYATQNTSANNPPNISGGPIKFKNSQRIFYEEGDHSVFHKPEIVVKGNQEVKDHTDKRTKFWLKFKSPKGYHREILVAADENTTDGFDLGYDAPMIEYNIEDMFWLIGATELVIQGVPDFDKARVIPMGLVIDGTENFTIEIAKSVNVPEGMEIYLKDKVTDSIHDLSKTGYVSTSEPGYINERFEIVFLKEDPKIEPKPEVPGEEIDYGVELSFRHAHVGRELQILNPKQVPINELLLFDMNGKLITSYKNIAHEKEVRLPVKNYSAGVYIAKLYAEGTVITKKIIIQN